MKWTHCGTDLVKKNDDPKQEKQNFRCLECVKSGTKTRKLKSLTNKQMNLSEKALKGRVSLHGICRIFDVKMPWLLNFINFIIKDLPKDLNAQVTCHEKDELKVAKIEGDERWSLVGNKKMERFNCNLR